MRGHGGALCSLLVVAILVAFGGGTHCDEASPCMSDQVCDYRHGTSGFCEWCPPFDCLCGGYYNPAGAYACCQNARCPQAATEPCSHLTYDEVVAKFDHMMATHFTTCQAVYEKYDANLS